MTDFAKRLECKRNIQSYISQLSHLSNREVKAADLLSLEATNVIREQAKLLPNKPFQKFKIKFSEKLDERFAMFVKNLYSLNSTPIHIWLKHTNTCGLFEIRSIMEFNFNFDYSVVNEGIISLLTKDLNDNIILDFFEDSGEKFIEIELRGKNWSTCVY